MGVPNRKSKTVFFVTVQDIPATLEKAKMLGAEVVREKKEIPDGMGFFARIKTPDGNIIGLYSPT